MKLDLSRLFVIGIVAASCPGGAATADIVTIPGTSVTIDAPAGFTVANSFAGLESLETGSSITITELPAESYAELSRIFTDVDLAAQSFAQQGIAITRGNSLDTASGPASVLVGSQSFDGGMVGKYLALFRGDMVTLITFNVMDAEQLSEAAVDTAVKSVQLAAALSTEEKVAQLPFSFDVPPPFTVGNVLFGATVALQTFEGTDPTGLMPVAIIARAFEPVSGESNPAVLGQQLLRRIRRFENSQVSVSEPVEFVGVPGNYLVAEFEGRTLVHYVGVPADGMYIQLLSFGESDQLASVLPQVRQIAQSVSVR